MVTSSRRARGRPRPITAGHSEGDVRPLLQQSPGLLVKLRPASAGGRSPPLSTAATAGRGRQGRSRLQGPVTAVGAFAPIVNNKTSSCQTWAGCQAEARFRSSCANGGARRPAWTSAVVREATAEAAAKHARKHKRCAWVCAQSKQAAAIGAYWRRPGTGLALAANRSRGPRTGLSNRFRGPPARDRS